MRKTSKFLVSIFLFGLLTSGCSLLPQLPTRSNKSSEPEEVQNDFDKKTREIYELYLANGGTLTYEEWLETIKGEQGDKGDKGDQGDKGDKGDKGEDGLNPHIGANGNWWIGTSDTGVSAKGDTGDPGTGIASIAYNGENELVVTFEDGRVVNLGAVTASVHQHEYTCVNEPATCTVDGYFQFTCKTCGHIETVIDKAEGHNFDAYRDRLTPTCTSDGVKFRRCLKCGYEETEVVPAHDHEYSENCMFDANKHWHYCLTCGVISEEANHLFVDNTCSVCSYVKAPKSADGLLFGLNDDNESYGLISIGTCTDTVIDIPSTYNNLPVTVIASAAFQGSNITSVTMPDTIKKVGDRAFYNCTKLASVTLSKGLKAIPSGCFYNSIIQSIAIPEGVKTIGSEAFNNCRSLEFVTISNTVNEIKDNAFNGCNKLVNIVIPASVRTIGWSSFNNCTSLKNVILNNGVKTIRGYAFQSCRALTTVTIPASVYQLEQYIFNGCTNLTSVTFEQPQGWHDDNKENIYKEVLSDPELAANQIKNSNRNWYCSLVANELYAPGAINVASGKTSKLSVVTTPETATSPITYESLDTSIATVSDDGTVTAVKEGNTSILVKSAGLVSNVPVFVGNGIYALNSSTTNSNWRNNGTQYQVTTNGITWQNNGRFYRSNWENATTLYSDGGKIENLTPISGVSKIVISRYVGSEEYYGQFWMGDFNISVGKNRDSLTRLVSDADNYMIPLASTGTGQKDYSGRELRKFTYVFDIPQGCEYFVFNFENWWGPIQEIAFF